MEKRSGDEECSNYHKPDSIEELCSISFDEFDKSRLPGESRGPGDKQFIEKTGFRLSPE